LLIPLASPGDPRDIARIAAEDDSILGDDRQLLEMHVNSWRLQGDAHVYAMVTRDLREVRGLLSPLAQSVRVVLLLRIFRRARVSLYLYRSPWVLVLVPQRSVPPLLMQPPENSPKFSVNYEREVVGGLDEGQIGT